MSLLCEEIVSAELASERFDRIRRETEELFKKHDERLRFPLTKLGERYVNKQLCVHVHFRNLGGADESQHLSGCAIYHGVDDSLLESVRSKERLAGDFYEFPVFVELVEQMDLQKRRIEQVGSVVWLQPIDSCKRRNAGESLYFSTVSGMFHFAVGFPDETLLPLLADGELDCALKLSSMFCTGKLPHHMIERRTEVVDDFASQNAQPGHTLLSKSALANRLICLSILVGYDHVAIGAGFENRAWNGREELRNFGIEVTDILIGPF